MPPQVIFFDMGQTLVTAAELSPRRLVAARLALSEKDTRKVGRLIMTHPATDPSSLARALKDILPERDEHPLQNIIEAVWAEQRRCVREVAGATSVLRALKVKGYELGLISTTWHPLYAGFCTNCPEMAELLDHIVLSYRLGYKKPSLDLYRQAIAQAGAPADRCWMVGDSCELDIEPALAVGMHAIWVLRSPEKERALLARVLRGEKSRPDWSVATLEEIPEFFSLKGPL